MLGVFPSDNFGYLLINSLGVSNFQDLHVVHHDRRHANKTNEVINQKECKEHGNQLVTSALDDNTTNLSEDTIHFYWYKQAGLSTHDIATKWENLKYEDNFVAFTALLERLSNYPLRTSIFAPDVVEVIQSVIDSPSICKLIFEAAREADADCDQRPLSVFNTIQGLARFTKLENEGANPKELLDLAKSIAKLSLLEEATLPMLRNRVGSDEVSLIDVNEALEYQMVLRRALGEELQLPFSDNLDYGSYSVFRLSVTDKEFALSYVNRNMRNVERLVEVLVSQPVWRQYMERVCHTEKTQIDSSVGKRMLQLERESQRSNSETYNAEMRKLGLEREQQIETMLRAQTKKLCTQTGLGSSTKEQYIFCEIF